MARVAAVQEAEVVAAMQDFLTPVFDLRRSTFAVAAPLAEHGKIASRMGRKGFLETVFGADPGEDKVLAVKEKDLDALFRLHGGGGGGGGCAAASEGGDETTAEESSDERWPIAPQPLWRTHRRLTAVSLVAAAAVTAAVAVKALRGKK